jgi:hypothetical protein
MLCLPLSPCSPSISTPQVTTAAATAVATAAATAAATATAAAAASECRCIASWKKGVML